MSAAKFFTDEDVYAAIAPALRKVGYDATSAPEARRLGQTDDAQLAWAARDGCVLVTFNVAHFAALHAAWISQGDAMQASRFRVNDPSATYCAG